MNTQTWAQGLSIDLAIPKETYSNHFLRALQHIDCGRLSIDTPEGTRLEFSGTQSGPSAYMRLYDWEVFDDLIVRGEIGFAEAYIDKRWETSDLPALITFGLVNASSLERFFHGKPLYALWLRLRNLFRANSLRGSRRNVMKHYDLGNEF